MTDPAAPSHYTKDVFHATATQLGVPPAIEDELYPMVRDLRALADEVNAAVATLPAEAGSPSWQEPRGSDR